MNAEYPDIEPPMPDYDTELHLVEPGKKDKAVRRGHVTWASTIQIEPVRWAWYGHVPSGELILFGGREGTGKSSFCAWITAQITQGTLDGDDYGTPRRVLYVGTEDSWAHTIAPRLIAAGANLDLVGRFDVDIDGETDVAILPDDLGEFRRAIEENDVAAVILDPLMDLLSMSLDSHKERDVREALRPLVTIAHDTGAAFLSLVHFSKGQGDVASLITGSGAFKNVARVVFAFATDTTTPDGERVMQQVKNSLGELKDTPVGYRIISATVQGKDCTVETSRFEFTGQTSTRSVHEIIETNRKPATNENDIPEAAQWLRAYLLETPDRTAPSADIWRDGQNDGFSKDQLKRAKDRIPGYTVAARRVSDSNSGSGRWIWEMDETP